MGGVLILAALTISTLLWADLRNGYVWAVLFVTLGYGALGFVDDYLKLSQAQPHGRVRAAASWSVQAVIGLIAAVWIMPLTRGPLGTALTVPVFKEVLIPLGYVFPLFGMLVMLGASNAVNLTDGLDGLAIVPTIIAAGVFALIAYLVGNRIFADYLQLNPGPRRGRAWRVLRRADRRRASASCGSTRRPPRCSWAIPAASPWAARWARVAVATKHEIVLVIVGGLFVVETVSVIIQVFWYKRTGRRVFLMAPLHHHFEKKGWAEPTIVIRFWIISMILALVGLATLKIR